MSERRTPPPWIRPWGSMRVRGIGDEDVLSSQANIDLAVRAVNALGRGEGGQTQLDRIEAKIDALTKWSGWYDGEGRPIPEAEWIERERHEADMDARWEQNTAAPGVVIDPPKPWWRRIFG